MKRHPGMNVMRGMLLAPVLIAAACGGEPSVASKSAAAYREAQAKGIAVGGGHDHGDQAATATTGSMDHSAHGAASTGGAAMDHSAHGAAAGAHAAMDHGTMSHSGHGGTGSVDHAAMGHGTPSNAHAGHTGTTGAAAHTQHAGMQQGTRATAADPHARHQTQTGTAPADHSQHGMSATSGAPAIAAAPRSSTEMQRVQPAATLRRDAFDAPAPVSVSEAAKAAQGGGHEDHGTRGITPGQDRENPPTPMPATRDGGSTTPVATDHGQHGAAAAATTYTCPMHPEVTSDEPGTCPKCGMALVQKN